MAAVQSCTGQDTSIVTSPRIIQVPEILAHTVTPISLGAVTGDVLASGVALEASGARRVPTQFITTQPPEHRASVRTRALGRVSLASLFTRSGSSARTGRLRSLQSLCLPLYNGCTSSSRTSRRYDSANAASDECLTGGICAPICRGGQ